MDSSIFFEPSTLKAFYLASETLNFTRAAKLGGMTQSGISQHMAKLEKNLKVKLFIKSGKKLILSEQGEIFKTYIERSYDQVSHLREQVSNTTKLLSGNVKYCMPESCLLAPHFQMMLQERNKYFPDITLNVETASSQIVIKNILDKKADFGFLTRNIKHPSINYIPFCEEEIVLVSSHKNIPLNAKGDLAKTISFIQYPGEDELFEIWKEKYMPRKRNLRWADFNHTFGVNNLFSVFPLLKMGRAAAFIPKHCVAEMISEGTLKIFSPQKNKKLMNKIHIITLKDHHLPERAKKVINTFLAMYNNQLD